MRMRWGVVVILLCLLGGALAYAAKRSVPEPPGLAEADKLFADRSYAKALEGYQHVLKTGAAPHRQVEVEYRVAVCLGRAQRWDEALQASRAFLKAHPEGLWGARGHYWLGQLLSVLPHEGYRVGERIYRGSDYPKLATAEKPERVWLYQEDREGAVAAFEQAKRLYEKLRPEAEGEEADLNFDLAQLLDGEDLVRIARALARLEKEKRPSLRLQYGEPEPGDVEKLRGHDWTPTPLEPYHAAQPFPQRILALYQQIEKLDRGRRAPQARLARALYLASYQRNMSDFMQAYDAAEKTWVNLPFPYEKVDAIALLRSIPQDFPDHPIAPQAQFTVGQWLENRTDFVRALQAYRDLLARWPKSKWVSDAKQHIQNIEWPSLGLRADPARPGHKATIALSGRNVKTVSLTAYRVQLEELLLQPSVLDNPQVNWATWNGVLSRAAAQGSKVATWTHITRDTGQHKWLSEDLTTPLLKLGAYLVEARSGAAYSAALLLISDLAIVQKTDRDRALAFICDAKTGQPVPGADVVLRERYSRGNQPQVSVERGQSDQDGLKGKALVSGPGVQNNHVEVLAWVGDRYAVTPASGTPGYYRDGRDHYRAYVYTDRPVYRPSQKVYFRAVLTVRSAEAEQEQGAGPGSYRPAANLGVQVRVRDPRREKIYEGTLTANEFGSLNGSLALGQEPALGEYRIEISPLPGVAGVDISGGSRFRVEEYKKPEFEVTVAPAAEQLRAGQTLKAAIKARYYFGSPVVGAEVKYRVFRLPHYPRFHFPRPYDWLIQYWIGDGYPSYYRGGEVVKQGEGRTDAQGELAVDLATTDESPWPEARAYTYTIEAEVTDESRRTITGLGEVRASKQQYFAFLDLRRGFYQVSDRIELELATRDVMDRPVAARGEIRVERVIRGVPGYVEALVHREAIATDKEGRAFFHWVPKEAGQYRFTYQAVDEWREKVTASSYTWVHGPDFDQAAFRLTGIQLIPEKQTYEEGETCKLLIVSSMPDVTLLLTQEAGSQVIGRSVLPLKGKSRVVEVPMRRGHIPNFLFRAAAVREWEAYAAEVELFVPPGKQFLDVSVTSDRKQYRPGEKATFTLKATDWRGQPVRAELSLGVIDSSLLYIQKEYAPDPRLFFYGGRRYANVGQNWSPQWQPDGHSRTYRARTPYQQHEWTLPEDMGQLQDWPPDFRPYPHALFEGFGYGGPAGPPGPFVTMPAFAAPPMGAGRGGMGGAFGGSAGARGAAGAMLGGGPMPSGERLDAYGIFEKRATLPPAELAAAQVRTQFADTAHWSPAIITDEGGLATVTITMPENLTTWRASVRGFTTQVQVGEASAEAVTRKDLIVRLQAPRFFMERDLVALSANVHNYLKADKQVKVTLSLEGGTLELVKDAAAELGQVASLPLLVKQAAGEPSLWVAVPKDDQRRVDWLVRVLRSGTASVRITAQTEEESDAVEMQFPALVHGAGKFEAHSGVLRDIEGSQTVTLTLNLPKGRRRGATELNLQLMPSLAAVALDALPYLADYPYGCIEQTMSRFLPTALVARTLADLGVDLDELRRRAEAYAKELETPGSRAQQDSAYTYPKGMPGSFDPAEMAKRMYPQRGGEPVFDRARLENMVRTGLHRIYSKQGADGGWGWWPSDVSDPYMTAYVCFGLFTAREAGWQINNDVLERGFQYLLKDMKEDDNLHRLAYLASVVTLRGSVDDEVKSVISDRLYRNRIRLTPYSQALLALALKQIGENDKARVLLDNLENTASIDRENGTANWRPRQRGWWWWHWWDNPVETNAAVLRAYLAIRPDDELAPMIVKWMVNNRRGNHWSSTKETALAVYALADFIRVKKELAPDYTITVDLEGKVQRTYRVNRENALFFDNRFIVGDEVIGDGAQTLTLAVRGRGTLYYTAYLSYFSLEEDLKGGGNEIFVQRRYYKLTPKLVERKTKTATWQQLDYERVELTSGAQLRSGDLVEVELIVDAKNDYEYLVFEDMKPAGCEPVEVRSGYSAGEGAGVWPYVELRDEKVAIFLSTMPQGTRAIRYRLRAEIPGRFHALPTNGYSMYAPDVRCLSDEWRVQISD